MSVHPAAASAGRRDTTPLFRKDTMNTSRANTSPSRPTDPGANSQSVLDIVRSGYAEIARTGGSCCGGGGCCGPTTFSPADLAARIGYDSGELSAVPEGANLGLSCGNPTALASLRPGEVVVDLGSGAGFDAFVAGPKIGPTGRMIGVDMTPEMLAKARAGIAEYTRLTGLTNVEFRLGEIGHLPVADGLADVVISNCVINLAPDKGAVWGDIARVLKPGGRVAVSDLALLRPLPPEVAADVEALVGCVAGAELIEETRRRAVAAGLIDITMETDSSYLTALTDWQDPLFRRIAAAMPAGLGVADFVTSLRISARKPGP